MRVAFGEAFQLLLLALFDASFDHIEAASMYRRDETRRIASPSGLRHKDARLTSMNEPYSRAHIKDTDASDSPSRPLRLPWPSFRPKKALSLNLQTPFQVRNVSLRAYSLLILVSDP